MGQIIKTNTITSEEKDVRNAILYFGIAFYVAFYIFYSFIPFYFSSGFSSIRYIFPYLYMLYIIGGILLILYSKFYLIDVKKYRQAGWIGIIIGGFYIQLFIGIILLLSYFAFINDNTKNALWSKILFYLFIGLVILFIFFIFYVIYSLSTYGW